jgi:hypothetical protein
MENDDTAPPGWFYKDGTETIVNKEKIIRTTAILETLKTLIERVESNEYTINDINRIYMQIQQLKFD